MNKVIEFTKQSRDRRDLGVTTVWNPAFDIVDLCDEQQERSKYEAPTDYYEAKNMFIEYMESAFKTLELKERRKCFSNYNFPINIEEAITFANYISLPVAVFFRGYFQIALLLFELGEEQKVETEEQLLSDPRVKELTDAVTYLRKALETNETVVHCIITKEVMDIERQRRRAAPKTCNKMLMTYYNMCRNRRFKNGYGRQMQVSGSERFLFQKWSEVLDDIQISSRQNRTSHREKAFFEKLNTEVDIIVKEVNTYVAELNRVITALHTDEVEAKTITTLDEALAFEKTLVNKVKADLDYIQSCLDNDNLNSSEMTHEVTTSLKAINVEAQACRRNAYRLVHNAELDIVSDELSGFIMF